MKYAPHLLGAIAVVAIVGAVSGASVGDSPILIRGHHESLPEARIVRAANADLRDTSRPPDHYPLETPQGTVEVAELALHGRLRDRGGDMWWEDRSADRANMSAGYDFAATASPERIAHEERLLAFTGGRGEFQERHEAREAAQAPQAPAPPEPPIRLTRAEAPMALAEPAELETDLRAPSEPLAPPAPAAEARTIETDLTAPAPQ
ncbi:hypothetical protein [Qipengyuania vesicularis]|uniref:hypothetical protein n=1 Tax=Qipengyuania vesicularis TaxID=2867232 RepID=UPI001C88D213|nr:hypothetical protein [Qipengyuania vesicularis]MBX7528562.1 hypothetical protein [Qipengyuania vesicularis]